MTDVNAWLAQQTDGAVHSILARQDMLISLISRVIGMLGVAVSEGNQLSLTPTRRVELDNCHVEIVTRRTNKFEHFTDVPPDIRAMPLGRIELRILEGIVFKIDPGDVAWVATINNYSSDTPPAKKGPHALAADTFNLDALEAGTTVELNRLLDLVERYITHCKNTKVIG